MLGAPVSFSRTYLLGKCVTEELRDIIYQRFKLFANMEHTNQNSKCHQHTILISLRFFTPVVTTNQFPVHFPPQDLCYLQWHVFKCILSISSMWKMTPSITPLPINLSSLAKDMRASNGFLP